MIYRTIFLMVLGFVLGATPSYFGGLEASVFSKRIQIYTEYEPFQVFVRKFECRVSKNFRSVLIKELGEDLAEEASLDQAPLPRADLDSSGRWTEAEHTIPRRERRNWRALRNSAHEAWSRGDFRASLEEGVLETVEGSFLGLPKNSPPENQRRFSLVYEMATPKGSIQTRASFSSRALFVSGPHFYTDRETLKNAEEASFIEGAPLRTERGSILFGVNDVVIGSKALRGGPQSEVEQLIASIDQLCDSHMSANLISDLGEIDRYLEALNQFRAWRDQQTDESIGID